MKKNKTEESDIMLTRQTRVFSRNLFHLKSSNNYLWKNKFQLFYRYLNKCNIHCHMLSSFLLINLRIISSLNCLSIFIIN